MLYGFSLNCECCGLCDVVCGILVTWAGRFAVECWLVVIGFALGYGFTSFDCLFGGLLFLFESGVVSVFVCGFFSWLDVG